MNPETVQKTVDKSEQERDFILNAGSTAAEHLRFTLTFLLFVLTDAVIVLASFPMLWLKIISFAIVAVCAGSLLMRQHRLLSGAARAREEHARFLAAAENMLDDFYIFDAVRGDQGDVVDFTFAYINPNAERRLKVERNSLIGRQLSDVRPVALQNGLIDDYRQVVDTGVSYSSELYLNDDMIKNTWIHLQAVKLGDGVAVTSRDITESKLLSEHVSFLAHHDSLTGLPNRALMTDRLDQAILRAQRNKKKVAVFMLDVDRFKLINDSLGHAVGDHLLSAIGRRLVASVRESDTIARLGGDEFVIIMPEFTHLDEVKLCGQQIVDAVARPIHIGDREMNVSASVGVCIYPDYGTDGAELLKNADYAMYTVKRSGRNGLHIYEPEPQLKSG